MAWWDSRKRRDAPASSWRRKELYLMDGLSPVERQLSREIDDLPAGVLSPISEEEANMAPEPPLAVSVSIKFTDPIIRSQYARKYGSSQSFTPTDRICKGLLRRIEHCCEELITRKDSGALNMCHEETRALKRQRYEMTFRILRRGSGRWAERTFKSYQKQPLTVNFTKEVILASHRMVGLFLRSHDKDFRWLDGTVREDYHGPDTVTPSLHGPLSPCCIPRSRFIETSQSFDFTPGYTVTLSFKSRTQRPARTEFGKVLRINSEQSAPLNLFLGEELLWQTWDAIESSLADKKRQFNEEHENCEGIEGIMACPHLEDDAVLLDLRITNNLGPSYSHLHHEFRSKLTLFRESSLRDSLDFIRDLETQLELARDRIDNKINQLNDFDLRLLELRSPSWTIHNAADFRLDASASYSRRTIEAVLERVQTGISDVLRGKTIAVHMTAYKRGHLILDKVLVSRQSQDEMRRRVEDFEEQKNDLMTRLKARITQDIDKVCRETCSLEGIPEDDVPIDMAVDSVVESRISQDNPFADPETASSSTPTSPGTGATPLTRPVQRAFSLSSRPATPRGSNSDLPAESSQRYQHYSVKSNPTITRAEDTIIPKPSSARPRSEADSIHSSRQATSSPRIFPLVPSRYSMASRSSSGSTLESQVAELLASAPAQEIATNNKDIADITAREETTKSAEPASFGALAPGTSIAEVQGQRVGIEQEGVPLKATEAGCNPPEPEMPTKENINVKSLQFELGPPISLVRNAHLANERPRTAAGDWDSSSSSGTTDDDEDSGAVISEPIHDAELPVMDDFARSRMDLMETSQYLPMAGNEDDDLNVEEPLGDNDEEPRRGSVDTDDQQLRTAPSTPGLSSGCDSSPRNSILTTPALRTQAVVKDGIFAVSAVDYAQDGPSLGVGGINALSQKDFGMDIANIDSVVDRGESPLAVDELHLGDQDEATPETRVADIFIEQVSFDAEVNDATDSKSAPELGNVGAGEEEEPATSDVEDKEENVQRTCADGSDRSATTGEGFTEYRPLACDEQDAELETVEAAILEPQPSPLIPSIEEELLETERVENWAQGNSIAAAETTMDYGSSAKDEASEADEVEADPNGSLVSEYEVLDPVTIELPPSPESEPVEATEGSLEVDDLDLDVGMQTLIAEEGAPLDLEMTHIALVPSEGATLSELPGCEPSLPIAHIDLDPPTSVPEMQSGPIAFEVDPPTSIPETQHGPTAFELDSREVAELQCGEPPVRKTTDVENNGFTENQARSRSPAISDWLVLSDAMASSNEEKDDDEPSHKAQDTSSIGQRRSVANRVAVDDAPGIMPDTEEFPQTAPSTSSYLTALEIPNPFELDSMPAGKGKGLQKTEVDNLSPEDGIQSLAEPNYFTYLLPSEAPPSETPSPVGSSRCSFQSASYFSDDGQSISHERDSVDTVNPMTEEDLPEEKEYRPSTAGWLGLRRETNPRRFSLPLQYLWEYGSGTDSRPGTPASTGTVRQSSSRRERKKGAEEGKPRPMSSGALLETTNLENPEDVKKGMLPKVVMLFAGMAFASKVMNGDG